MAAFSHSTLRPQLSIYAYLSSDSLTSSLGDILDQEHYIFTPLPPEADFLDFIEREKQQVDCLILEEGSALLSTLSQLQERAILLPTIILEASAAPSSEHSPRSPDRSPDEATEPVAIAEIPYHPAIIGLSVAHLDQLPQSIDVVISRFVRWPLSDRQSSLPLELADQLDANSQQSLMSQQRRLAEKLKERLGYLGIYYKRNPANFLRRMSQSQGRQFLQQLRADYRDIILNYFSNDPSLNEKIDNFVNMAFFADISVSRVVEIHMELMDEFSKQLKLEGRSEEILLDYRLTLIDTIAHLCEMYRRSIPRGS